MLVRNPSQEVGNEISHIFSEYLMSNEPAIDYLENRGINKVLIDQKRVGFCPPFLKYWFPLMKGRIVVTIQDVSGNILGFAGRQYEPSANAAKQYIRQIYGNNPVEAEKKISMWERSKWINETYPKLRHLYNLNYAKDYIRKLNYGIIVEGYFDVLTLVDNGLPNTVAVCSPELSQRHLILLSRYCDHVVVLSDGDERGAGFSETWSNRIEEAGLKHHSIYLPLGYDPDELVLKIGGDKLKDIIESIIGDKNSKLKLNLK